MVQAWNFSLNSANLSADERRVRSLSKRRLTGRGSFRSDLWVGYWPVSSVKESRRSSPENGMTFMPGEPADFGEGIIGKSAGLGALLNGVETVAPTDSTVLILGETGTGKELIARAVHNLSPRRDRAFVRTSCASIPGGLLESELFGREKGAYTGAVTREIGRIELANGGTLFLDEIGEIPLELQSKLLRVLQQQEFERLGSTRTIHVDFRLLAATNRDLAHMVKDGRFRSDLYYRLNVFPLTVPPLRSRPDDIPFLVWHFVKKYAERMIRRIDTILSQDMAIMIGYSWPGNVRELQNFIERSVILSLDTVLRPPLQELR